MSQRSSVRDMLFKAPAAAVKEVAETEPDSTSTFEPMAVMGRGRGDSSAPVGRPARRQPSRMSCTVGDKKVGNTRVGHKQAKDKKVKDTKLKDQQVGDTKVGDKKAEDTAGTVDKNYEQDAEDPINGLMAPHEMKDPMRKPEETKAGTSEHPPPLGLKSLGPFSAAFDHRYRKRPTFWTLGV